jgi:hypothetical protein
MTYPTHCGMSPFSRCRDDRGVMRETYYCKGLTRRLVTLSLACRHAASTFLIASTMR